MPRNTSGRLPIAAKWSDPIVNVSSNVLGDCVAGLGFLVCIYYGFTGFACAFYYRKELGKSVRNFLLLGLGPFLGGVLMWAVGVKGAFYYGKTENVSSKPILGITLPLWMGIGGLILGFILALVSRPYFKEFFSRKRETAPPGILDHPLETMPPQVDF